MLEPLWHDLRHGARVLAKNPGFAAVAMLSIALGVGANAAMFSVADGMVLRPLQVPRADEIVAVAATSSSDDAGGFIRNRGVSYPDYVDLRANARSFAGLIAYRVVITSFAEGPNRPAQTKLGLTVSGNFFDVLGVQPALGRTFRPDEDIVARRDAVLVLAHDTWTAQFGSDPGIIGRTVRVGGTDFTVIGVAAADFPGVDLVLHPAFYVPLAMSPSLAGLNPDVLTRRNDRSLTLRGRLAPGVSLDDAQAEVSVIAANLAREYPDTNTGFGLMVRTFLEARIEERGPAATASFMLLLLTFLVLLVACANLAGLLMSRAPARRREIALRLSIGASRGRVIRQLLGESVLIAAGGAALGLGIAYGGIRLFSRFQSVSDIGVRTVFELDDRVLWVGLVLAAASAILSSLVPAWRATRNVDLSGHLGASTEAARQRTRLWGRNGLVAGQVALSLLVLTAAVFLYRTLQAEFSRPGFRTERLLLTNFQPALAGYQGPRLLAFYDAVEEQVRAMGGVTSVGLTSVMPMNQDYRERSTIAPEGYRFPPGTEHVSVFSARIDDGYLETMAIPLIAGRSFTRADTAQTRGVAIVNETLAARYWPGQTPIGRRILLRGQQDVWVEIVGVAADSKYNWIGEAPTPFLYLAHAQAPSARATLVVASRGDAAPLAAPVRAIVQDLDPDMPVASVRTIEEFYYGSALSAISAFINLAGAIGITGLALAMVGLYALVSYAASRRTREIGVRMAVGARPASVLAMVLRHGIQLALAGTAVGVVLSIWAGRLLRAVVPSTQGIDLTTFLIVVPLLVSLVLIAAFVPARRAARIDPAAVLRGEM